VGQRADLDVMEKRKIYCHCREPNPGRHALSLVAIPTELTPAHVILKIKTEKICSIYTHTHTQVKKMRREIFARLRGGHRRSGNRCAMLKFSYLLLY
jgi:hypothetical protein